MSADAIVVGAGIIGGSIAWRLAQRGLRVTLLDAGRMGGEASGAAAGMLAPGGEIEEPSPWASLAIESLGLYPAYVAELEAESGVPIDFQRHGAIEGAFTVQELAALDRRAAMQRELGIASERVDPRTVEWLAGDALGARFFPGDALVDPRDVMRALRAACLARGVELREGAAVRRIEAVGGVARVDGQTAGWAVLAAGAWSSSIDVTVDGARFAMPRAYPVRGHLIAYRQPAGSLRPILRHHHTYLLQRAGGSTVAGTTAEEAGFDRTVSPAMVVDIRERAARLAPRLAALTPAEEWLGFRPAIERNAPAMERAGGSALWLAYGHYRNGVLLAPASAARVSAMVAS